MPLHRRVPKRGFHNPFRVEYRRHQSRHARPTFDAGTVVTPELLRRAGPARGASEAAEGARPRRDRQGADGARAQVQREGRGENCGGGRQRRSDRMIGIVNRDQIGLPKSSSESSLPESCTSAVLRSVMESLKNIFTVSDLRNRVFFTLGLLGVYRIGHHIPTPGVDINALAAFAEQLGREQHVRPVRHVLGRQPVEGDGLRAGHHALHQRVDHPAAADGGVAVPREALEGRRAGPAQDHAVHPLRHDRAERRAVARHRVSSSSATRRLAAFTWSRTRAGRSG